jgi:hypothetical protein
MALKIIPEHKWLQSQYLLTPNQNTLLIVDTPYLNLNFNQIKQNQIKLVYLQCEPEAIVKNETFLLEHGDIFDIILTYNDAILKKFKHAYLYQPGETWIAKDDWSTITIKDKEFKISNLTGGKLMTPSHYYRQTIYNNQLLFDNIPIVFFRSEIDLNMLLNHNNNPIIGKERSCKIDLFKKFQYHLAIENTRQLNYFSEKLNDCLLTKTIPIYYGCPNISDYYNTKGWIILETLDINELLEKIANITSTTYMEHVDSINENYIKAQKYTSLYNNINSVLMSISLFKDAA